MTTQTELEYLALNAIIEGHHKQALAIPTIMVRSSELMGDRNVKQTEKTAHTLFMDILTDKMAGVDLQTCLLAVAFLNAELYTQAVAARSGAMPQVESDINNLYG